MKRGYKRAVAHSKVRKSKEEVIREARGVPMSFLKEDLVIALRDSVHNFAVGMGMVVGLEIIEAEVKELCGLKYERGRAASRYGSQPGYIIVGGQKIAIEKPRVRSSKEVELKSYKLLQREEALGGAALGRMLRGVSTRQYEGTVEPTEHGFGKKRSSVSRHFVKATREAVEQFRNRRFDGKRYPVIFIDGIEYGGEMLVAVLGIDSNGTKEILGLRQGATENKEVVASVFQDLIERGLPTTRTTLFVIDGGKALGAGIKAVFGKYAVIQRCQVHKRRNIKAHVPERHWPDVKERLDNAYNADSHSQALKSLNSTAKWLDRLAPDAADSLREGMEETVTVLKLDVPDLLLRSLASTNIIESALSVARQTTNRVTRWRDGDMRKRWCLSGLLKAEQSFQKIRGASFMDQLINKLDALENAKEIDSVKKAA